MLKFNGIMGSNIDAEQLAQLDTLIDTVSQTPHFQRILTQTEKVAHIDRMSLEEIRSLNLPIVRLAFLHAGMMENNSLDTYDRRILRESFAKYTKHFTKFYPS